MTTTETGKVDPVFSIHEVRELAWIFQGPGILSDIRFPDQIESDLAMKNRLSPHLARLSALERDPRILREFLASIQTHGRLGRYFEALLKFYLLELVKAETLQTNLQIREGRQTIGELDVLFREARDLPARHWEASVKFYLCTAENEHEAKQLRFFMGTLVWDRLDRKLEKLLEKQLKLPLLPQTRAALEALGMKNVESRALLKGFLYYPSHLDWRRLPHPAEVSPHHARGWWTTDDRAEIPQSSSNSLYMILPPARWLAPFYGEVQDTELLTRSALIERARAAFSQPERPRFPEMMVAEVALVEDAPEEAASNLGRRVVREVSRGNLLSRDWPAHARASLENSLENSETN
jgi:uncharacterized protein